MHNAPAFYASWAQPEDTPPHLTCLYEDRLGVNDNESNSVMYRPPHWKKIIGLPSRIVNFIVKRDPLLTPDMPTIKNNTHRGGGG